jgi:ribonuclease HI
MDKRKDAIVELYADGACSGNPGPGGYGAILRFGDKAKEISGCDHETTNNRMEMMAVIQGLLILKRPCRVRVVTDSNYVVRGMTEWVKKWIQRKWINSKKEPVLNRDLWETPGIEQDSPDRVAMDQGPQRKQRKRKMRQTGKRSY